VDPIQVPEDLTGLTEDELTQLGLQIQEQVEALAEEAKKDDSKLSELERLVSEFDRVNDELTTRESAAAEREERVGAVLQRFAPEGEDDADVEEADLDGADEGTSDDEPVVDDNIEASVEVTLEASTDDITDDVALVEPVIESRHPVVSALKQSRPAAVEPIAVEEDALAAGFRSRVNDNGLSDGQTIDISALAELLVDRKRHTASVPTGTFEKITLASATVEHPYVLGTGYEENFAILDAVRSRHAQARAEVNALVASGGNCAPLEPDYDFFRLAEAMNPVESCLPTVQVPRGGIRFISPPDFRDAAAGVRVTTEVEDASGYPPTAPKPCVAVACPPVEECRVDVVSQCVRFGNLNFRTFPEQVESFLQDLAVIFTETKEIFYLDAIDNASTAVTAGSTYGAVRSLINNIAIATANYRRRHHMAADAVLELFLPSWIAEFVYVDLVNDHSLGLAQICEDPVRTVQCAFATLNLNVCFYYDSATGAGQEFNAAQAAGVLNSFPTTVVSYIFAPGTFVRLDGGTLDVGMIRDSSLNGTNDLEMFSEEWLQVCFVGLESIRLEHTLCPDGTAPEPLAPFVCA